jgi:glycosyltransferase involved in cell wall biosynthesis
MDRPLISLIISTINRTVELSNLLKSLEESTGKNIEIIIIDQNANNQIDDIINSFSPSFSLYCHIKVDFIGASKARNYGVSFAHGEYIWFPDDDCEFFVNTFENVYKELEEHDLDVICGRCIDRDSNDSVIGFSKNEGLLTLKRHAGMFVESTMIFKKEIIASIKFDELIGAGTFYGSGEGYDLVLRMLQQNKRLYYTPSIILYHPTKIITHSSPAEIKRSFSYSTGFSYVCKKHNKRYKYYSRLIKVILYLLFCCIFRRLKIKFYLAELSGLIAGRVV